MDGHIGGGEREERREIKRDISMARAKSVTSWV